MSKPDEPPLSRLQELFVEYGVVAFVLWWIMAFAVMIPIGVLAATKGGLGLGASVLAAWAGAQPTKPLRIGALVVLTPIVARWFESRSAPSKALDADPQIDGDAGDGEGAKS